jgi:hypothetical protein
VSNRKVTKRGKPAPKKAAAKVAPKQAKKKPTRAASSANEDEHLTPDPFHEHGGPFTIEQGEDRFIITGRRPQPPLRVKPLRRA